MRSKKEMAGEIRRKRDLAAKGLKVRRDGKAVDPMKDVGGLDADTDPRQPLSRAEKQENLAERRLAFGLGVRRQ